MNIGDTVKLKSGGPLMTVHSIEKSGDIYCQWFAGDEDKVRTGFFPPDSLQLAVKKKGTAKSKGNL
jgi:uncharacterized protein YodC (DUF2158 family)